MSKHTQLEIFRKEESLKDKVYKAFDDMLSKVNSSVDSSEKDVIRGSYEDQEAFMVYGKLSEAHSRKHIIDLLVSRLYNKPYFAHIEVYFDKDKNDRLHCFLSDCEGLDSTVTIGNDGLLLPFKLNENIPISRALYHSYLSKNGKKVTYKTPGGDTSITSTLICDTDVQQRQLLSILQLFPTPEEFQVTADELLESRLQENRNNPMLRNIISTLQLRQFEIIGNDVDVSFVVQGCAGSGKSQCLFHRLFFLRDQLSSNRWEKVLLLTPTDLFRQYSADLMRRYQLSDISNCSLADLYRQLLNIYDDRFKDRQYVFQLTEEFLPDDYLASIYEEGYVRQIELEIDNAINKYISAGCNALGMDVPEDVNIRAARDIVYRLSDAISEFDDTEKSHENDKEYQEKRNAYEGALKEIDTFEKKKKRVSNELEKNRAEIEKIRLIMEEVEKAKREKNEWMEQREVRISEATKELLQISGKVDRGTDLQAPSKYAKQLYIVTDMTKGQRFKSDEEELMICNELLDMARAELNSELGGKNPSDVLEKLQKRREKLEQELVTINEDTDKVINESNKYAEWLREKSADDDGREKKKTLVRAEMQQARYYLSRLESAVFEQEVWNALAPLKERYGIQTLEIEKTKDGKRRENRILYKSDLMFYIKIYQRLHPFKKLPEYTLICIDEGQDLHRADYSILYKLFPKAVYNVFGDTEQVLHEACGISNWEEQTGIPTVYKLETNYRNTASIVDFCNKEFGTQMDFIGGIEKGKQPQRLTKDTMHDAAMSSSITVIVKDKDMYQQFCSDAGIDADEFEFLDTTSHGIDPGRKQGYSIFAAKGLEFKNVLVYAKNMTKKQKVVACTRAMGGLYYYE